MTTNNIDARVVKAIAGALKIDEGQISLDSSLTDDLGADSLDSVEVMMALEVEFQADNLNIPDEDAAKIRTVREAVNYITSKVQESHNNK